MEQNACHEQDNAITTLRSEEEIDNELNGLIEDEEKIENSNELNEPIEDEEKIENSKMEESLLGPTSQTTFTNRLLPTEILVLKQIHLFESIDPKALDSFTLNASKDPLVVHLPNYGRVWNRTKN
ncbi:hypothetical protein ACFX13_001051 [Malus domestica]